MFGFVRQYTLFDGETGGIGIEVEFGNVDDLEIGVNDQALELLG